MPNFTACEARFSNNLDLYKNYTFTGPVTGTSEGNSPLLTLEGCYELCGRGVEWYEWTQASSTILTWIMPMLALLVKAPFGAGSPFKATMRNTFRWVGSPVASLAYIFWNIKVTGKCALMVDMATLYDKIPGVGSEYADMRDSLYILSVMNQYSIRTGLPNVEAEKLLRVALFSDTLKLNANENAETLPQKRRKLAYRLRAGRRQGLVPVFVSCIWWMFGLSISLENAFGNIGANATAHNLAIGLMLAWFPVLILCSIVDRTPWATDEIRIRLNNLLDYVREALLDKDLRDTYMRQERRTAHDFKWVESLRPMTFMGSSGFFTGFAGQGRVRFHYGVANPILTGVEEAYVVHKGRGWLGDKKEEFWQSRTALVLGPDHGENLEGLKYFDPREFWEVLCAILMVGGPIVGAFIISYFTPTVGLGCRSGGYTIFFIIAFSNAFFEALAWWLLPKATPQNQRTSWTKDIEGNFMYRIVQNFKTMVVYDPRCLVESVILRPMDLANTIWLVYIIMAQTFGSYNTCECQASIWAGGGGYISFAPADVLKANGVTLYWGLGTGLSLVFMVAGIAYIVSEWLTQSHLNTTNYDAATRGLRRTRTFKKWTLWARMPVDGMLSCVRVGWEAARGTKKGHRGRRSLVWSWRESNECCGECRHYKVWEWMEMPRVEGVDEKVVYCEGGHEQLTIGQTSDNDLGRGKQMNAFTAEGLEEDELYAKEG